MLVRAFEPPDTEAVVALWRACKLLRPWNDPYKDIARKLAIQPELFLVALQGDALVGTAMAGYDGHRGWLYYLAVRPESQGEGIGRVLVHEAEVRLQALGCPKVNLQIRSDNDAVARFYARLGYHQDEVASMGKRLEADA